MQLIHNRKAGSGDGKISFPGLECWNPVDQVATIAANVDKTRALCRISLDTLREKYGASEDSAMRCLTEHRDEIHQAATRLIQNEMYDEDGTVLIQLRDLE